MKRVEIIPTKEEAKAELVRAKEILDSHGIENTIDPEAPIDWVDYIDKAQDRIGKSGSGQRSGTIVLTDSYPINRTLYLDAHVTLEGSARAKWTISGSHGFYIEGDDFDGEFMLEWRQPTSRSKPSNYSNFGAGIHQIHIESKPGTSGVYFRGAQQACKVDNLIVRGYGENAVGIQLSGDTYTVRDTFSDAAKSGQKSVTREGSTGFKFHGRVYSLALNNITVHNCETGMEVGDAHQVRVTNYETELTELPIKLTWQAQALDILSSSFRHTDKVIDITKVRWPKEFRINIEGVMSDHNSGIIKYPTDSKSTTFEEYTTKGKLFDITLESDSNKTGLILTDNRRLRLDSHLMWGHPAAAIATISDTSGTHTTTFDSGSHPASHICSGLPNPVIDPPETPGRADMGC